MMRVLRFVIGCWLLPLCGAAAVTLAQLLRSLQAQGGTTVPAEAWALAAGFALWILVYLTLPRPARSYVLAHELTHVLWAAIFGIRVYDIHVKEESGSVSLEKTNVLINLAPYFFPLYTVLVIAAYYLLSIFWDVSPYQPYWMGLVGFSWGFHFTFTVASLLQHQTDTRESGYLFAYALIVFLNVIGICLWVVVVSDATLERLVEAFGETLAHWVGALVELVRSRYRGNITINAGGFPFLV